MISDGIIAMGWTLWGMVRIGETHACQLVQLPGKKPKTILVFWSMKMNKNNAKKNNSVEVLWSTSLMALLNTTL